MNHFLKLAFSLILFSLATIAFSQTSDINFATTKITANLYMLEGKGGFAGGNIALLVGDDGVVLVDNSMPPMLDKLNAAIAKITANKPVDFMINTHIHGDHIGNNAAVAKTGARIVAHKNLRKGLLKKLATDDKLSKDDLPVITLADDVSFYLNGENTHVTHTKRAHTDGDLIVHFKNANVIHTGDTFFNGLFPFIDVKSGGSIDGYISAQKKVISMSNKGTKIIPGHGPMADVSDLQTSVDMLVDARSKIHKLIKSGKNEEEIVKANPLKKYGEKWTWNFITTEKMTRQIFSSLKKKK